MSAISKAKVREYVRESEGPGKFMDGMAVYLDERAMDGDGEILSAMEDGMGTYAALFGLDEAEADAFGIEERWAVLYEDSDGFCWSTTYATEDQAREDGESYDG